MILTKEQQAQKYAENIAGNTCMAPVIAETWLAGYTAAEQSMWRSVEEGLPKEMERVLVWTGDEALVCWFTSMRRFRTTLSCQERYVEDESLGIKQHLSPCRADVTEVVTHWQRIILPSLPDTNTEKI